MDTEMDDVSMSDSVSLDIVRPPSDRPAKRRRRSISPTRLHQLPVDALKAIIRYLHPPRCERFLRMSDLSPLLPLRLQHSALRDAFDAHVVDLDMTGIPTVRLADLITTLLPRLPNLATLSLPAAAQAMSVLESWRLFFTRSAARLRHVIFLPASDGDAVASLFARACAPTLEAVSAATPSVLSALVGPPASRVASLELLMDGLDERMLGMLSGLREVRLLYRAQMTRSRAQTLCTALCALPALTSVHLRANGIASTDFCMFRSVPYLTRLALFDGRVEEPTRGITDIVSCSTLEELHLEWMEGLSTADLTELCMGMRRRLRGLRIWNCEKLTDEGILAIAQHCPTAEVELRFVRQQFSLQALAALGDQVSWGSTTG